MKTDKDRTLALAGVFLAAKMVKDIAWHGKCQNEALEMAVNSLFKQDAINVNDVFSNKIHLLVPGLEQIIKLFDNKTKTKDNETTRYVLSMLHLERLLAKKTDMIETIQSGIRRAKEQANIFGETHNNVIANVAGLYTDTISTFSFRIHVTGEPNILNNNYNANQVRALLLFGIRCAVLWRQLGGSKWQLVFAKKKILDLALVLQKEVNVEEAELI